MEIKSKNGAQISIIGNSMIGSEFAKYGAEFLYPVMIIAAGVSDSKCINQSEFLREEGLVKMSLEKARNSNQKVIYVSTYSSNDSVQRISMYVQQKLKLENWVLQDSEHHVILRPTNVIGSKGNPINVLNFLCDAVKNQKEILVWRNAYRNFIDVFDLVKLTSTLTPQVSGIVEIVHPHSYSILEIIESIQNEFRLKRILRCKIRKPMCFTETA